jgi:dTDP-4-dehydrorhamnose 3,5-epimerase-like enzyme
MANPKVIVKRLTQHIPPLAAPITNLGRILAPNGEVAQIANGAQIQFLATIEFAFAEQVRANHYHERRNESLYVIRGSLRGVFIDIDTNERSEFELVRGDLVEIAPRCAHAFVSHEPSELIEFADLAYDPMDLVKYSVL